MQQYVIKVVFKNTNVSDNKTKNWCSSSFIFSIDKKVQLIIIELAKKFMQKKNFE